MNDNINTEHVRLTQNCRKCGACCIAPSISSPLPGMPQGKAAGMRCVNLCDDNTCRVYEQRPPVCQNFTPGPETCGNTFKEAMVLLGILEAMTAPFDIHMDKKSENMMLRRKTIPEVL